MLPQPPNCGARDDGAPSSRAIAVRPAGRYRSVIPAPTTPQAMRSPAFPDGSVR